MAFSDKYLATGSSDNTVNLIDIQSKTIYHKFDNIHESNNNNNKYIMKLIPLFLLILYLPLLLYHQYIDYVNTVAFSPNGKYLATGSSDNTVNLIEV